jgi:TolA-binding protein
MNFDQVLAALGALIALGALVIPRLVGEGRLRAQVDEHGNRLKELGPRSHEHGNKLVEHEGKIYQAHERIEELQAQNTSQQAQIDRLSIDMESLRRPHHSRG